MLTARLQASVERALSAAWNGEVMVSSPAATGLAERTHVHRLPIAGAPPGSPSQVIVKSPRLDEGEVFDPASKSAAVSRFFNEWACLQFLSEICAELPGPQLYAASRDDGFLVLEDVGPGGGLDQALMDGTPRHAIQLLTEQMKTLGRMHAETFGREAVFDELLRQKVHTPPRNSAEFRGQLMSGAREMLTQLDVKTPSLFWDELAEVEDRFARAGDFRVLVHGDPCPDNCVWDGARARLLDFEHARFAHAFSDGSYPRIHFPTCWCMSRLPHEVTLEAERAYRSQLGTRILVARDDERFEREMVVASAYWVWRTLGGWHMPGALAKDETWGLVTVRQRILFRLGLLVDMLQRAGWYSGIATVSQRVRELLTRRWTDVADMPVYPAFAS